MSHLREKIRDALKKLIIEGGTTLNSRVYIHRKDPIQKDEYPLLLIHTLSETTEELVQGYDLKLKRTLTLTFSIVERARDEVQTLDSLEVVARAIENLMFTHITLMTSDDEAIDIQVDTPRLTTDYAETKEKDKDYISIIQTWEIDYITDEPDTISSSDLEDINITYENFILPSDVDENTNDLVEIDIP